MIQTTVIVFFCYPITDAVGVVDHLMALRVYNLNSSLALQYVAHHTHAYKSTDETIMLLAGCGNLITASNIYVC
jgi:hypothetical protein